MNREEQNRKLKAFITCLKCEVSGKPCDDNCPTQYEAGNMGEIIENLEAISKALEQEPTTKNDLGVDKFDKAINQSDLEEWIMETFPDWCVGDVRLIMNHMDEMPSVTPQEPRKGHWNNIPKYKDIAWQCSECKHFTTMKHNYCPNCGADMREVGK